MGGMPVPVPVTFPPWAQVVRVGRAQRALILVFLAALLAIPISMAAGFAGLGYGGPTLYVVLFIALRVAMAVAIYRVSAAMGSKLAVLWAIGGFLPNIIGLIVLLVQNQRATGFLKRAGVKPGFLGVKVPPEPPPDYPGSLDAVFS